MDMEVKIYYKFKLLPDSEKIKDLIPIFATQQYADYLKKTKNSDTTWFVTKTNDGVDYLIPFAVMKKGPFKKGTFLTATISLGSYDTINLEKSFLNKVVEHIKVKNLCDWIQQCPNWAIFNTYPNDSKYAAFGTYKINLDHETEDQLYKNLYGRVRGKINKATREGKILIKKEERTYKDAIKLIEETLRIAKLSPFTKSKFDLINRCLKDNIVVYTAYVGNVAQSTWIYFYNSFSMYGLYGGSIRGCAQGATELLVWEAIKEAKKSNVKYFDFVGALIEPDKNTKAYRIQRNKSHFGSELKEGYLWKMIINKKKYVIYIIYLKIINVLKGKKHKNDFIDRQLNKKLV